jgi:hypothetical protein
MVYQPMLEVLGYFPVREEVTQAAKSDTPFTMGRALS